MRGVTLLMYAHKNFVKISTHTPHARRDSTERVKLCGLTLFQLTRLMRGVTETTVLYLLSVLISTHTPHARRDRVTGTVARESSNFNSHASCEA